jgi:type IV secretion system protein VirB6
VKGSATELFASRIDAVFAAIAEVGQNATETSQGAAQQAGTFTPSNLMWLSAVMLLLSTVGVLVTAKIALAVLLAIGPVFVTLALFRGTRGLFAGWLRGVALTACASLFAVLGGGFMLELVVPIVARLREAEAIDSGAVLALFLVCAVHVALMGMVFSVMGTMVSAWSVFGLVAGRDSALAPSHAAAPAVAAPALATAAAGRAGAVAEKLSINRAAETAGAMHRAADRRGGGRAVAPAIAPLRPQGGQRSRNRGVGSTYRQPVHSHREFIR